jgi:hypothetical protein
MIACASKLSSVCTFTSLIYKAIESFIGKKVMEEPSFS